MAQNTGNRQFAKAYETARLKNPQYELSRKPAQNKTIVKKRAELPAVNNLGVEGVDHINTHYHSDTELGRALCAYGSYPFNHPEYGRFRTVHGLMCWLGNPNQPDSYRNMSALAVENHRTRSSTIPVKNYRFTLMQATWMKIQAHPEIGRMLVESTLPLEHYYLKHLVPGENTKRIRIRPDTGPILIRAFEEIRKALKENRQPLFDFLLHESERAAYRKSLTRECENLVVALTPRQEEDTGETSTKPNGVKKFSPSQKKYRKKYFERKEAQTREREQSQLVQAEDGSMEHRPVDPVVNDVPEDTSNRSASTPVDLPVNEAVSTEQTADTSTSDSSSTSD